MTTISSFSQVDVRRALQLVRPNIHYGWKGDADSGYATLTDVVTWRDQNTSIPTDNDLMIAYQNYINQKEAEDALQAALNIIQISAKADIQNIPNWAGWTKAQLQTWWDSNLSDAQVNALAIPAGAKTIIIAQNHAILAMGFMLIALRNREFPDLQS